jgi:hypothetical protein
MVGLVVTPNYEYLVPVDTIGEFKEQLDFYREIMWAKLFNRETEEEISGQWVKK